DRAALAGSADAGTQAASSVAPSAAPSAAAPIAAGGSGSQAAGHSGSLAAGRPGPLAAARPGPLPPEPPGPPRARGRPAATPAAAPIEVTLKPRYPAHLIVDGADLGTELLFHVALTPGPHRVIARKDCCADNASVIDVTPTKLHYQIELGRPLDANILVAGAP